MSLDSLTNSDSVDVYVKSITPGDMWGQAEATTLVESKPCAVQTSSGNESQKYAAYGQQLTHRVFFSSDPQLTQGNVLDWNGTILRVLAVTTEGPPGEILLWTADCESETSRRETV